MYVRRIRGEEARLGVSGTLWRDALVFFDRGTGSYWSQVHGQAISGPLEGSQLEEIPSQVTTWGEWKRLHPETLVLRPSEESRGGSPYSGYFDLPERLGVLKTENPDTRLPGKSIVLGIREGGSAAAIPVDALGETSLLQATVGSTPVVIVHVSSGNGFGYDRRVEGDSLDFARQPDGRLRDTQTGSLWEPESGRAVEGPLEGRSLRRLDTRRVYWFVWAAFNPRSDILGHDGKSTSAPGRPGP